ncbi:hypothetical protein RRG08_046601 [Elysia crispata]|uniref:Uncharacterized protein n=1 Tax=Elysia crispata TaxID=231223 RepID=A0AAE1APE1_9GAST|nr:hypothetical protein RRG08_046601 [Elysia crispata]
MHENCHSPEDDQMIKKEAMRKQQPAAPNPYDQKRVQEEDYYEAWLASISNRLVKSQSVLVINNLDVRFTRGSSAEVNTV